MCVCVCVCVRACVIACVCVCVVEKILATMVGKQKKVLIPQRLESLKIVKYIYFYKNTLIGNALFKVYLLISVFPAKYLIHFTNISEIIMKLTSTWCNTIATGSHFKTSIGMLKTINLNNVI